MKSMTDSHDTVPSGSPVGLSRVIVSVSLSNARIVPLCRDEVLTGNFIIVSPLHAIVRRPVLRICQISREIDWVLEPSRMLRSTILPGFTKQTDKPIRPMNSTGQRGWMRAWKQSTGLGGAVKAIM